MNVLLKITFNELYFTTICNVSEEYYNKLKIWYDNFLLNDDDFYIYGFKITKEHLEIDFSKHESSSSDTNILDFIPVDEINITNSDSDSDLELLTETENKIKELEHCINTNSTVKQKKQEFSTLTPSIKANIKL